MSATLKRVFISSTAIDLPEHRQKVIAACLERSCFPDGMEHWPAADANSLDLCLAKVDQADLFIGIYAHRYGWIPPGESKSITELEYDRAVELGIPRLLFLMSDNHPVRPGQWETGSQADALNAFKQRIQAARVRASFDNPDQLRAEVLHALSEHTQPDDGRHDDIRIDFTHLPAGAEHFFGREEELAVLEAAWADSGRSRVVELVAPGGVGKSSLVKRWLESMGRDGWRGARRVYGWSFYSQGTSHDRQASDDAFLSAALAWFGVKLDPATNPWDKGQRLAEAVAASRTLLVLDGVEPLQYPPGPLAGDLRAPGIKALLECLASAGQPGLCLVTSRERLTDLAQYERNDSRPEGVVLRRQLDNLGEADGARLLHVLGANQAGVAPLGPDDEELKAASREVRGHALTLSLLGRYLALAYAGDIRKRDLLDFQEADAELDGGHAFKVIAAYENWFAREGKNGERELAALRLLGFFDYPASLKSLRALRKPPALPEVTRPLVTLKPAQWQATLQRLVDCGLAFYNDDKTTLDAHPLVREYQAKVLQTRFRPAWRKGNKLLYEFLAGSVKHRPDDLVGLQPLYQAVVHGCRAGLYEKTLDAVYRDRILRGTERGGFYSTKKLGSIGADLGAVACFFTEPWRRLVQDLPEGDQVWLLNEAATRLRALGRLEEALEPMRVSGEMDVEAAEWKGAAISYVNLSGLQLSLGRIGPAVADAERAVGYADPSGDAFRFRGITRTTLAAARHQRGDREAARSGFAEAEAMQTEDQPLYPLLYSLSGFRYCDLLLAEVERVAWGEPEAGTVHESCALVARRAAQTLTWAENNRASLLDVALGHLTLARCALYADLGQGGAPGEEAQQQTEAAVAGLVGAGHADYLPLGLLTRAWLRHCLGDISGAQADLAEAQRIAERGGMKLFLADIALCRARLFDDTTELDKARALIEECDYGRRLPELEDAEKRLGVWVPAGK